MNLPSNVTIEPINGRFLAADNARFWCMFAVVALHCTCIFTLGSNENTIVAYLIASPFKFSTIGFFLVSGFLLEKDFATRDPRALLFKRLRKVFLPWLLWAALFVFSIALADSARHGNPFLPGVPVIRALSQEIVNCLTGSALWFVPNLLVSLSLLLIFRKHLQSLRLGAALLGLNLFYTLNVYAQWIPAQHTRALFAFVFYLWLGHYAATHLAGLNRLLAAISTPRLLALTALAAALSFAEGRILYRLGSVDPLNTLRPSNQLFSILAVLCFAKLRRRTWPRFVDVPRHTFGIYLSHALILRVVFTSVRRLLELPAVLPYAPSLALRAALWLLATAAAWTTGFLLSRQLAATPGLCWMQGLAPSVSASPRHRSFPDAILSAIRQV